MALEDVFKGYGGQTFPLPKCAGTCKGRSLIICADAACVWDDLERFGCRSDVDRGGVAKSGWDFMTVNKLVETFPGNIAHLYSNEPWLLNDFIKARRAEYVREFGGLGATHSCNKGAQWRWPWSGRGSSGLGATLVGLGLGYDEIVLCGMPLDNSPHNGEPPWRKTQFLKREVPSDSPEQENEHWKEAIRLAPMKGRVFSMSGRTRAWLGLPGTPTSKVLNTSSSALAKRETRERSDASSPT